MDKIFIKNYTIIAKHGYYKEEHFKAQRFVVSVIASADNTSGDSDDLNDTFNYEHIKNIIDEVIKGEPRKLLEYLAEKISGQVLAFDKVNTVEVEIIKPDIWGDCTPGISIKRNKNN
ncbi:MAG: 7,8-dihydroneopterin aldolase/epimerase/oxygenase [Patescibacteria group bacterium]|nr:7,8-dihydroneopterin aldolase/epimerase/oxygenase [Patescibacteria group bacterium]